MADNINFVGTVDLNEDDIRKAASYLPILDKTALAQTIAPACIQRLVITLPVGGATTASGKEIEPVQVPLPDLFQEDLLSRTLYSAFVLLYFYLKRPDITGQYDPNQDMKLAANDYDRYPNLLTQLERIKATSKDREVRDKAFSMLADYKDFEKRLGAEIHNILAVRNDVCARLTQMVSMQTEPETIQKALKKSDEMARSLKEDAKKVQRDAVALAVKGGRRKALEKKMNETAREKNLGVSKDAATV